MTLYYASMRRGEALGMTTWNIDWDSGIIRLNKDQTKEHKVKRVLICLSLLPILRQTVGDRQDPDGIVFLIGRQRCCTSHCTV